MKITVKQPYSGEYYEIGLDDEIVNGFKEIVKYCKRKNEEMNIINVRFSTDKPSDNQC